MVIQKQHFHLFVIVWTSGFQIDCLISIYSADVVVVGSLWSREINFMEHSHRRVWLQNLSDYSFSFLLVFFEILSKSVQFINELCINANGSKKPQQNSCKEYDNRKNTVINHIDVKLRCAQNSTKNTSKMKWKEATTTLTNNTLE